MKNTLIALMLLVFVGCFTVCQTPYVFAQEKQAVVETLTVSGNLSAVDLAKSTITLTASTGKERVMSVNATTTIVKAGQAVKLADLVVGDAVTAGYIINDVGEMVVLSLSVE